MRGHISAQMHCLDHRPSGSQSHRGLRGGLTKTLLLADAEEEVAELAKLRKLLCLTKDAVADIDHATKGRVFRAAVQDALAAGIDGFTQVGFTDRISGRSLGRALMSQTDGNAAPLTQFPGVSKQRPLPQQHVRLAGRHAALSLLQMHPRRIARRCARRARRWPSTRRSRRTS